MKNFDRLIFIVLLVLIVIVGRELLRGSSPPVTYEHTFVEFDPDNFSNSTNIDNQWLPLKPSSHWVYEGTTTEGGETFPHSIEFTVTDLIKEIEGVRTVVVWAVDISDNEIVEKEIAFYAQDNDGNVWYFGEYPEEYESGEFINAPTWIAGEGGAKAGVMMWGQPSLSTPSYFEGWGPDVDWSDYASVDALNQETCVPVNCYKDVLVIAESSLEETDAFQLKYFAPGVGNVRVGWRGEDATQEELELVYFKELSPSELEEVRLEAQELEKRAHERSPDVYGQTQPIQPLDIDNQ